MKYHDASFPFNINLNTACPVLIRFILHVIVVLCIINQALIKFTFCHLVFINRFFFIDTYCGMVTRKNCMWLNTHHYVNSVVSAIVTCLDAPCPRTSKRMIGCRKVGLWVGITARSPIEYWFLSVRRWYLIILDFIGYYTVWSHTLLC